MVLATPIATPVSHELARMHAEGGADANKTSCPSFLYVVLLITRWTALIRGPVVPSVNGSIRVIEVYATLVTVKAKVKAKVKVRVRARAECTWKTPARLPRPVFINVRHRKFEIRASQVNYRSVYCLHTVLI